MNTVSHNTAGNIQELRQVLQDVHRRLELLRGYL
jgi:hypothetical protein